MQSISFGAMLRINQKPPIRLWKQEKDGSSYCEKTDKQIDFPQYINPDHVALVEKVGKYIPLYGENSSALIGTHTVVSLTIGEKIELNHPIEQVIEALNTAKNIHDRPFIDLIA